MAPRAVWRGFLKVAELTCAVGLYSAASTSERISLHSINRETGRRLHRQFIDSETQKPVEKEKQVKGYEIGEGDYVALEPEELAPAQPHNSKTIDISSFIACEDVDDVFFDKPYYLAPSDKTAEESFRLLREGLKKENRAAVASALLFRRIRTLVVRPHGAGMLAMALHYDYEARSAKEAFADVPAIEIPAEAIELAQHIIRGKMGVFDPSTFENRYEKALADLIKAKIEGRKIVSARKPEREKVVDLMAALRESAAALKKADKPAATRATKAPAASRRPKAG
ncbi:Ku protein [Methylocystis heyeri]|uniref:Non-homologous end joining protein Ku n=1 Tax=Methylocystis heyeri TaxID=391905 RepID=A0A6B8KE57_9HYPH|nr:Ku protein [Methylocystis heyeri]QGM46546.1 Ku protein [Methylocystis heyeri]